MKILNKKLFVSFFVLGTSFILPATSVNAENINQVNINQNQSDVNENQANINERQNRINENQNKINENQSNVNKNQIDSNQLNGVEHRSFVATFVQQLLNLANREGGIGDQVKVIANEQNDSKDNVANTIDQIKNRSGFKTFFIGTDYKNIGQLRSEMVKTANQIDQLKALLDQTINADSKVTLQAQIQKLEQQQQKINDFIKANEGKFSLFGWFVKLFNK
ncbi:MAG: hypothetical protein WC795_03015 [Candidatus Paceibacterota bacterium]|jgi:hypothetical protein